MGGSTTHQPTTASTGRTGTTRPSISRSISATGRSVNPLDGRQASAEAYLLEPAAAFPWPEDIQSYAEKTADCEAARGDPMGFFHGIHVTRGGKTLVLSGPPKTFRPNKHEAQMGLFGV